MFQKLTLLILTLFLFAGCGDSAATAINTPDITPVKEEQPTQNTPEKISYDNHVQELIDLSKKGTLENVTYICIGDSTRAISQDTEAQLLFEAVSLELENYRVTSYLQARGNHTLEDFIDENISPTWSETVALIPNEGESTIVDISLGVNDFFALNATSTDQFATATETIKERLRTAIALIKAQKPKTTFFLTAPNPSLVWEQGAQIYQNAYIQVAQEDGYLFMNFVDEIMPARENEAAFAAWYRDEIHFSRYGLDQVANYILAHILPKE